MESPDKLNVAFIEQDTYGSFCSDLEDSLSEHSAIGPVLDGLVDFSFDLFVQSLLSRMLKEELSTEFLSLAMKFIAKFSFSGMDFDVRHQFER